MEYLGWALLLGAISAVSLPLGSLVGLRFKFLPGTIAVLAAFGAGALLAALSVELIAPTAITLTETPSDNQDRGPFFAMVFGCLVGGLIYVVLDKAVNSRGGFLRRNATLLRYYRKLNTEQQHEVLQRLAAIPLFQNFPAEHAETLLALLEPVSFKDGDIVCTEGDDATATYLILDGSVEALIDNEKVAVLDKGQVAVSILSLLLNMPYVGTGIARGKVKCLKLSKTGFEQLRELSPEFDRVCRDMAAQRLESLEERVTERNQQVLDWLEESKEHVASDSGMPDASFMRKAKAEHHGAPFAIWLGMLLDGIPESLVIGAGMFGILTSKIATTGAVGFIDVIPFTLVAGLFLSNFPEALSSSASMLIQGWGKRRIFLMWFTLMIVTSIGAGLGYLLAGQLDHTTLALLEGLAAGAMLTMIAAAMIPEAVLMSNGNTVGLSTLAGFLSAVLFKLLE